MAEISLRGYIREIDELIEREKLDEAIAHCRHILQTYPKHLETYRLLGKAYLEAKRYGDAADIFQRVLSAVPDDFVSHIGMAIVREDEGNLDASIWHMERAFETNPANPAIQQELRRLIGRRDGLEPHKVRLTRGALARMYAHGELYQQAITELRSALQEDPERPDLQVLLADMYWRTGQQNEAVAVSGRVLEKLPNCLEANRVLAASLRGKERIEESAVHHRRLAGLDPYASFIESTETDTQSVEPSAVTLERLEWKPGQPIPSARAEQPGWAATLGMELQERQAEEATEGAALPGTGPLPSWLEPGEPPPFLAAEEEGPALEADMPVEQAPEEPAMAPEPRAAQAQQAEPVPASGEIPGWMRDAGWGESTGEAAEQPISFSDEELGALAAGALPTPPAEVPQGDLTPAQLPDWIRDIAPSAEEMAEQAPEPEPADMPAHGPPSWLQQAEPEADEEFTPELFTASTPEPAAPAPAEDRFTPEEITPELVPGQEQAPAGEAEELDSRGWPTWIADEPPGATDTIVTWLDRQDRRPAPEEEEAVPQWMEEIELPAEPEAAPEAMPIPEPAAEEAAGAMWPEAAEPGEPVEEMPQAAEPVEGGATPGWLAAVAEAAAREEHAGEPAIPSDQEPQFAAEPAAEIEHPAEEPPDWITELVEVEQGIPEAEALPSDAPDWMAEGAAAELESEAAEAQAPESMTPAELGPAEPEPEMISEMEPEGPPAAEVRSDVPEWLQGLAESVRGAEATTVSDWPEEAEQLEAMEPAVPSGDTPDWLKGLAEEGPPTSPTAEPAEAPDWLKGLGEPGAEPAPASADVPEWLQPAGADAAPAEPAQAPDWLTGLAEEQPAEAEVEPASVEGEAEPSEGWQTPDWLEAAQAEQMQQPPAEAPAEPEPVVDFAQAEEVDDEQVMDWLEDLAAKQSEPAGEETEEEAQWLEISFGEAAAEPLMEERYLPEEPEEGLEWLEQLAEQRGLDIDVGLERPAEAPAELEAEQPAPSQPEVSEPAEAPEWMQRMASAPTIPIPRPEAEAEPMQEVGPADETLKSAAVREGEAETPEADETLKSAATRAREAETPQAEEPPTWEPPPAIAPEPEPVVPQPEEEPEEEVPEWLSSFASDWTPAPRPTEQVPEQPPAVEPTPPAAPPSEQPPPLAEAIPQPSTVEQPPAPPAAVEQPPAPPAAIEQPPAPPAAIEQPPAPPAAVEQPAMQAPEQPPAEPTPPPPTVHKPAGDEELLDRSRQALAAGEFEQAVASYAELVKGGRSVEAVIEDLQIALDRSPENASLWQCLGDAYMKDGQVSEAIDAYRRGMEAA